MSLNIFLKTFTIVLCVGFFFTSCSEQSTEPTKNQLFEELFWFVSKYKPQADTTNVRAMVKITTHSMQGKHVAGSHYVVTNSREDQIGAQFYNDDFSLVEINNPRWNTHSLIARFTSHSISHYFLGSLWESAFPNDSTLFTPGQQGIFAMDSSAHYPASSIPITVHNLITPQNYQASDTISADSAFTAQWSGGITNQGFLTVLMSSTDMERSGVPHHLTIYKGINNTQSMLIPASALQAYRNGFIQFTIEINTVNMVTLANGRKVAVWQVVEDIRTVYVK